MSILSDFLEGTTTDGQHFASISKVTGGWDDSFATRSVTILLKLS